MSVFQKLYHRSLPERMRVPLGRLRRGALDRIRRASSREPFPPSPLLASIQPTPWLTDYLLSGQRAAHEIRATLDRAGASATAPLHVLDFGCGPARILRHLRGTAWDLFGCDTDAEAIAWCERSFPGIRFVRSSPRPPLPFPASTFDAVVAIALFPHFSREEHGLWRSELARILKPNGMLVVSTLGPSAAGSFGEGASRAPAALRAEGYFEMKDVSGVAPRIAFHTPGGVARLLSPEFALLEWRERALDGVQDLVTLKLATETRRL